MANYVVVGPNGAVVHHMTDSLDDAKAKAEGLSNLEKKTVAVYSCTLVGSYVSPAGSSTWTPA